MQREILFRGKRLDNGEWIYGTPATFINYSGAPYTAIIPIYILANDLAGLKSVDPATVGPYTGLTDKNGVKIFEGDIFRINEKFFTDTFVVRYGHCGGVQNVEHEVGYVGFYAEPAGHDAAKFLSFGIRTDILYWLNRYKTEVIGNIHDNQEFLEVQNDIIDEAIQE